MQTSNAIFVYLLVDPTTACRRSKSTARYLRAQRFVTQPRSPRLLSIMLSRRPSSFDNSYCSIKKVKFKVIRKGRLADRRDLASDELAYCKPVNASHSCRDLQNTS